MKVGGIRLGERRQRGGRRATDKFHLQHHNPAQRRFRLLLGAGAVLLFAWGAYTLGVHASGYRYKAASRELYELREYTAGLEVKYADLLASATRLRQSSQIEHTAAAESQEALIGPQDDLPTLNKELLFYKGIVSSSEMRAGLHVQKLELRQTGAGEYYYTLVLTVVRGPQWLAEEQQAEGRAAFYVEGAYVEGKDSEATGVGDPSDDGKPVRLPLPGLTGQDAVAFSFKYFQTLEGEFTLPAGFTPTHIVLHIESKDKRLQAVEQTWPWAAVVKEV